jgi:multidrug efflux pump subunit AcrA (membrane-fusion protein)
MSRTVPRDAETGQRDNTVAPGKTGQARPRVRRRRAVAMVLVLVVLGAGAATGIAWRAGPFGSHGSSGTGPGAPPPATQPVLQEDLSSTTPVTATLGYAASYSVRGQGGGTLTWLPSAGQVIRQGQVLYRVDNGTPVVLLYGSVPAWRTLDTGLTGADVTQLNHDLVALGYASSSDVSVLGWDYFSWETAYGVQRLESALGVSSPPGSLPLGSVVFEPEAIRITSVLGSLGGPGAGPVLAATSDRHVVTVPLSTAQETEVAVGDPVSVTLPDGASTPGTISSVGAVASGMADNATIQVTVMLTHPSAAGTLDQAPVTVYITTASSPGPVLAVPVGALLAQSSGGYSVEVIGAENTRRLVPVTAGIFDDNSGLVQVTGALTPGEQVVVPAT